MVRGNSEQLPETPLGVSLHSASEAFPLRLARGQEVMNAQRLHPWRPTATPGPILARSLRSRWESYRARLWYCKGDFSEESVHELRVASRRLIAQLALIESVIPGTYAEKARSALKRRLKALSELRDVHVQRLFMEQQLDRFPEFILLRDSLQRRERRLGEKAAAKIKGFKTKKVEEWIDGLEKRLSARPGSIHHRDDLSLAVSRATQKAFAEVVRRREAIDPASPATIHSTRVAFKKFRYMVESLSPGLTGMGRKDLRKLAHYQRRMGALQDLEVTQRCIGQCVKEHVKIEPLLVPFLKHLRARRARALRSFLKTAGALYTFWPPQAVSNNDSSAPARQAA
jgi:CHAD domain-containing protein